VIPDKAAMVVRMRLFHCVIGPQYALTLQRGAPGEQF
jgi:hypothetical protein